MSNLGSNPYLLLEEAQSHREQLLREAEMYRRDHPHRPEHKQRLLSRLAVRLAALVCMLQA